MGDRPKTVITKDDVRPNKEEFRFPSYKHFKPGTFFIKIILLSEDWMHGLWKTLEDDHKYFLTTVFFISPGPEFRGNGTCSQSEESFRYHDE